MSAFIDQQRATGFAVELTCRSIGTSPSAYYQRATGQLSTRAVEDARLLAQIRRVSRANYETYGSLRIWKALRRVFSSPASSSDGCSVPPRQPPSFDDGELELGAPRIALPESRPLR